LLAGATATPSLPALAVGVRQSATLVGREARPHAPADVLPSPMRGGAGGGGEPHAKSHDHPHDHHHHPYPHAKHPLGPVTLPKIPGKLAREDKS
jgi:sirohydrochlorin cobaltochelatase